MIPTLTFFFVRTDSLGVKGETKEIEIYGTQLLIDDQANQN